MSIREKFAKRSLQGLLALAVSALPAVAAGKPLDLFYERTVMTEADTRCGLFTPEISAALAAGQAQARGAALRAGAGKAEIADAERRARSAVGRTACDSKDIVVASGRVRQAFEGFAKMTRITYPGDLADWQADRNLTREPRWRLSQKASFGWNRMIFGLAGREGSGVLLAVADFRDGRAPYAARLVMRDGARTLGPYLDKQAANAKGRLPLASRLPPGGALKVFQAEARSQAGEDLAPETMKAPWAFRFPTEAARELATLDPREAVAVEFMFSGTRDETVRAYVEVGDFAAGRAFLKMATR